MLSICVVGDAVLDGFQEEVRPLGLQDSLIYDWRLKRNYRISWTKGGAALLGDLVARACTAMGLNAEIVPAPREVEQQELLDERLIRSLAEVETVRQLLKDRMLAAGDAEEHIRISRLRGFSGPLAGDAVPRISTASNLLADMVVVDDAGNGFRYASWVMTDFEHLVNNSRVVLVKLGRPLDVGGELRTVLTRCPSPLKVVIVNANDLRSREMDISRHLSWERTAQDLTRLCGNRRAMDGRLVPGPLDELRQLGPLIVRFGYDGAVLVMPEPREAPIPAIMVFDCERIEDEFENERAGKMIGGTAAFTAAIAGALVGLLESNLLNEEERQGVLTKAMREGLAASRKLYLAGFSRREDGGLRYPVEKTFSDLSLPKNLCAFATHRVPGAAADVWSIVDEVECPSERARQIVRGGVRVGLRDLPIARFRDLIVADRFEIESYRSIANLFREYVDMAAAAYVQRSSKVRPISIAVFGPPGSGKSYGIKKVVSSINDQLVTIHEFNLTQFEDPRDLTMVFHIARDIGLEGRIPLVIFDEFDCQLNGQVYGWLKAFLAPMQDGVFKDEGRPHPIGHAIFVFAGGVVARYKDFTAGIEHTDGEGYFTEFKKVKGPDFVSRLRGYVDVRGPNPAGKDDPAHVIRRAILLRSLLERKQEHTRRMFRGGDRELADAWLEIDEVVLRAFLDTERYIHGSRSLEAIIDMSMLTNRERFEQSALPPDSQLEMHVDSSFVRHLRSVGWSVSSQDSI